MNLRHRHGLPLTRPAVSSRGGYNRHERVAEIEPSENEHELCLFGRRSSNIIGGLTRSDSDEGYLENVSHKTEHYVHLVVHEERAHDKAGSYGKTLFLL